MTSRTRVENDHCVMSTSTNQEQERYERSVEEICLSVANLVLQHSDDPEACVREMKRAFNMTNVRQRCWANTKKGRRCRLYAQNRRGTCYQHRGVAFEAHPDYTVVVDTDDEAPRT